MLKILHTSDWHLGLRFCGYDPTNEYESFFKQLTETVNHEKPDALLITGDIFDFPTPSENLFQYFEQCLAQLHDAYHAMQIVLISGNHDDAKWLEKQAERWQQWGVYIIGKIHEHDNVYDIDRHIVVISDAAGVPKGYIIGIPYTIANNSPIPSKQISLEQKLATFMTIVANRVAMINLTNAPVVMMAHCFVLRKRQPGIERQKATILLEDMPLDSVDYFALGHYHSSKSIDNNRVHSCGAPWPITPKNFKKRSITVVTIKGRKQAVTVSERWINNQCPLVLLPKKPAEINTVLEHLADFPEDEQAFINLHVQKETDTNEKAFIQRCKELCVWKRAHLCSILWVQKNKMWFSHIADTTYLSHDHSFLNQKEIGLPTLVAHHKKSLNTQLTQLDEEINKLHRKEDSFVQQAHTLRKEICNLAKQRLLQQQYDAIKEEENRLWSLTQEPQYRWEELFIEQYQALVQITNTCPHTNTNALNDKKKELADKAIELYRGTLYTALDLKKLEKKIEILKKYLPNNKKVSTEQPMQTVEPIMQEYQQEQNELEQQVQQALSRIQSIENLLDISLPKKMDIGRKIDDLLEQLDMLQKEALEYSYASGQKDTFNKYLIERISDLTHFQPALWSTEIWKEQEFHDLIIQKHRLIDNERKLYSQTLNNLQKQIDALEVSPALKNSVTNPDLLLDYLAPFMADQFDHLTSPHSALERQHMDIRLRINEINLIESKLNEAEEKEESD